MYEACRRYGFRPCHRWIGEDFADLLSLSIYTGLRISDAALFSVDRMKSTGEIRSHTTKAGTHVYKQVRLPATLRYRATSQLSGGQKARQALARALAALGEPGAGVLILDESLAILDLSVQALMINLLVDLQEKRELAYILIAHDPKHAQTAYLVAARTALDEISPHA